MEGVKIINSLKNNLELVISEYKSLDSLLYKLSLEQDRVENMLDIIDTELTKALNERGSSTEASSKTNIGIKCLEIAKKVNLKD